MDNAILTLESVNKTYLRKSNGRKQVVRAASNVSLSLKKGQILAVVGESGSGKSTLAKLITGVEKPDSGRITFEGKSIKEWSKRGLREYHKHVQMVFQDPFAALNPLKTVGYAISRPLTNYHQLSRREILDRILEILKTVQLTPPSEFEPKLPFELSGGQLQRVVIARAIASNPKLIVADEPVSMLDVSIRADIIKLLADLREHQGVTFLYITHDLISARMLADDIVVLYRGTVVERGPANEVALSPKHPYTQLLLKSIPNPWVIHDKEHDATIRFAAGTASLTGCVYADRCPFAMDKCVQAAPELVDLDANRAVSCFLYSDKTSAIPV